MKISIEIVSLVIFLAIFFQSSKPAFGQSDDLIDTEGLTTIQGKPGVVIIDARDDESYMEAHIPGAVNLHFSSILELKDSAYMKQTGLALRPEKAEELLGSLGISNDTRVVVYDSPPSFESPIIWLSLKIYGLDKVQMLSGGIKKWKKEKRPLTKEVPQVKSAVFKANPKTELVATSDWIVKNEGKITILDARGGEDYIGATGGGHIPGAFPIEWIRIADARNSFKSPDEIRELLNRSGVTKDREIVTYCQVGPKASVLFAALKMMGYKVRLYWGSMAEWSKDPNLKVER